MARDHTRNYTSLTDTTGERGRHLHRQRRGQPRHRLTGRRRRVRRRGGRGHPPVRRHGHPLFLAPDEGTGALRAGKPGDPADLVSGFEAIIADPELPGNISAGTNFLDATDAEAIDIDLAEGCAVFAGIDVAVDIANFRDVRAGGDDDRGIGHGQDNSFRGSRGDDVYVGGERRDSLFYGDDTEAAITLGLDGFITLEDTDGSVVGRDTAAVFDVEAGEVDFLERVEGDVFAPGDDVLDGSATGDLPLNLQSTPMPAEPRPEPLKDDGGEILDRRFVVTASREEEPYGAQA